MKGLYTIFLFEKITAFLCNLDPETKHSAHILVFNFKRKINYKVFCYLTPVKKLSTYTNFYFLILTWKLRIVTIFPIVRLGVQIRKIRIRFTIKYSYDVWPVFHPAVKGKISVSLSFNIKIKNYYNVPNSSF